MARLFEYKCKDCGYTKAANPKGHDMIMSGEINHYLCEECKKIVDVFYPYGEKPEEIVCPECGSIRLHKWNPITGKCPKCGGGMKKQYSLLMVD